MPSIDDRNNNLFITAAKWTRMTYMRVLDRKHSNLNQVLGMLLEKQVTLQEEKIWDNLKNDRGCKNAAE